MIYGIFIASAAGFCGENNGMSTIEQWEHIATCDLDFVVNQNLSNKKCSSHPFPMNSIYHFWSLSQGIVRDRMWDIMVLSSCIFFQWATVKSWIHQRRNRWLKVENGINTSQKWSPWVPIGGGNSTIWMNFHPWGFMIQFDNHIFRMGWWKTT